MASDVKWIKIVTDIFDDEKMLLIDGLPKRDSIIVIWFKLLCLAGKQNNSGVFTIGDKMAYTDEMLATIFHRPVSLVRSALKAFENYGMIEVVNGVVTIPNWEKHQTLDSYEKQKEGDRLRQAKRREIQRALTASKSPDSHVTVTDDVTDVSRDCHGDVTATEEEKEKDIDIDIQEREHKKEKEADGADAPAEQSCPFSEIKRLYHEICVSFPTITVIEGTRRKAVAARYRTYRSLDKFAELFKIAEASSFLKGNNSRNWSADFDWLMGATNFAKVLEHKYDDHSTNKTQSAPSKQDCYGNPSSFASDEFFDKALARSKRAMELMMEQKTEAALKQNASEGP